MGEVWQPGGEQRPSTLRVRRKTLLRWGLPALGGVVLVVSLVSAVGRGEDGRRLSQKLDQLEADELILRDHVATQKARADSLAALPRMEVAAREVGLRPAGDGEVFHLSEPPADDAPSPGSVLRPRTDGGR